MVTGDAQKVTRLAVHSDAKAIGQLLHDFNREFGEPTPSPRTLADRVNELLRHDDTLVVLAGQGPDGLAVMRFRPALWSEGLECYLAELYVVPEKRRQGLGRVLMGAAMQVAHAHGADTMDIGVDESDMAAQMLYQSLGFTNRGGGSDGPLMYLYERPL